ncbi:MAG: NAD-dependent epimerase/dehydratase family protein [Planctomycetota bacterium]|jgi:UDP-glucose 4-epimerase
MSPRILVTGGAGLIGSALVERALEDGWDAIVLDNLSTGRREHLPASDRVELIRGDVCDDQLVGALVRRCELVAHMAAGVGVGLVLSRPTGTLRQSLLGTEIVLRHAAAARRPVFFASTSEVYGDSEGEPLGEKRPVGFGTPERIRFTYAAGKAAGEALAFAYAAEYALPVVVGRFFNVTGPRQSRAVIPTFVEQALKGGPLTVHGDGSQTRSFLDATDGAEYVWRLLLEAPVGGLLVNIGRNRPVTIGELATEIANRVDPSLEIVRSAPDYGEGFAPIRHRCPDVRRLLQVTRYEPVVTLDETLDACVRARRPSGRRSLR